METKHFLIEEFKATEDGESRSIEGYGSFFNNVDSYGDIVLPGAFVESLKDRQPSMLWQHRSDMPIGIWDTIEETKKGLFMRGRILDTTLGLDAYKLAKAGALKGLSIGFTTKKYEIDEKKKVRKLQELELYEVSLVTFPANEKATITGVKSRPQTIREFEERLREGGFSQQEATTIALHGFKALERGEPELTLSKEEVAALTADLHRVLTA